MNKKRSCLLSSLALGVLSMLFSACGSSGGGGREKSAAKSSKTGWEYNKRETGGFEVHKKYDKSAGPGLVPVEGGTFVMGGSSDVDLAFEQNNLRRRVTVSSFYMDETEVSNIDWLEYLHWIRRSFPEDREYYHEALPDTLVWRRPLSYNEPYVDNYLRHPAYGDYPVVGITWEQASAYCVWRTDRVNENILRSKGILMDWKTLANGGVAKKSSGNSRGGSSRSRSAGASQAKEQQPASSGDTVKVLPFNTDVYLAGQYTGTKVDGPNMPISLMKQAVVAPAAVVAGSSKGGAARGGASAKGRSSSAKPVPVRRPIGIEDGIMKQPYRLPTEAEWEYAALALVGNTDYENIEDGRIYPWSGLGVRSSKKESRGLILANFKRKGGDLMGTGGYLNDKFAITSPVRSYIPNDFGLYNMAGNVSEWTSDVYRQLSYQDMEDLNPYRGNVFDHKKVEDDGKKRKITVDRHGVPLRTLAVSSKKLSWKEMLKNSKVAVAKTDTASSDSTAVADGGSSEQAASSEETAAPFTVPTYGGRPFKPDVRDWNDTSTNGLYGNITLINSKSRVYKGASWNDRAYWLNPSTRRHMQQDESSAEIGFRCAMTMVGSPEIYTDDKPHLSTKKEYRLSNSKRKKGVVSLSK